MSTASEIKRTMKDRWMWEKEGTGNACRICGQFIDDEEDYYLKFTSSKWKKVEDNFLVHAHEWDSQYGHFETLDEAVEALYQKKKPKTKNATKPNEEHWKACEEALGDLRWKITKKTKNRIYFKPSKKIATFYFDARWTLIEYTGTQNGLFDRFALNQWKSRLENAILKRLGETPGEEYDAVKAIGEVIDTTLKKLS